MSMQDKEELRPWKVGGRQNKTEIGGFTMVFDRDGRAPVAYAADPGRAEQIVAAVNSHAALREALEELLILHHGTEAQALDQSKRFPGLPQYQFAEIIVAKARAALKASQ